MCPENDYCLQVGRYGTVADKGYVSNGVWTREGWQLLKVHVIHAAGWLCFQERRRNASSAPLRQMGKLELRGQNEKPSSSMQPKDRLHSTQAGRITKDRLHSTLSGRITKPAAAKPSQSALTDLLSSILTDAAKNASSSASPAHSRLGLQRPSSSHNVKSSTKKQYRK
ncbi:hypothetical protein AAVH_08454 [Aphelenchoides avenae]|nr:hypothetical protein AAVH_08454 [Aphelenchus avenae]